jgi:hypothetical protein
VMEVRETQQDQRNFVQNLMLMFAYEPICRPHQQ